MINSKLKLFIITFIVGGFLGFGTQNTIAEEKKGESLKDKIVIMNLSYRTGPYKKAGIANGMQDYINYYNNKYNGVNGKKLYVLECETSYNKKKGVDCFEKNKHLNPVVVTPYSTGLTYKLL